MKIRKKGIYNFYEFYIGSALWGCSGILLWFSLGNIMISEQMNETIIFIGLAIFMLCIGILLIKKAYKKKLLVNGLIDEGKIIYANIDHNKSGLLTNGYDIVICAYYVDKEEKETYIFEGRYSLVCKKYNFRELVDKSIKIPILVSNDNFKIYYILFEKWIEEM